MKDRPTTHIEFTLEFKRNIRRLAKKYRNIRSDIEPLTHQLARGETPGSQIQGTGYTLFKVRAKNSDINKGQSSGYRIIYYLKTVSRIILVTIYSKTEQGDISPEELRTVIAEYHQQKNL